MDKIEKDANIIEKTKDVGSALMIACKNNKIDLVMQLTRKK